jgi:outer membrane protein assembly factor BamB
MSSLESTPEVANVIRELGPFEGVAAVHGVTFDGTHVYAAVGHAILVLDPESGRLLRTLAVPARAGTAFDGTWLYQLSGEHILALDPHTGREARRIAAPGGGVTDAGLAYAEGSLWVGQYSARVVHEIDPRNGRVLRTVRSDRFVTGVTWAEGELWHGTWEGGESELRHIDAATGEVRERLALPTGTMVSGLEAGPGAFYCGGGGSGRVRVVAKPAKRQGRASK